MRNDDESGFVIKTITAPDGLRLSARDYSGDSPALNLAPIVCLPGLTRNSRDFHELALLLSRDPVAPRRVITLDARGRGLSAWDDDKSHYNLVVEAQDVLTTCAALNIPKAVFIGTSRGGLVLHLLAAGHPDILRAVILNDIGPVLEKEGLVDIRDYLNRNRKPANWDDAVEILRENHGRAFTALTDDDWRDMARAIYTLKDGNVVADFDPAIAVQMKSLDFETPLPDLWPQFEAFQNIPLMVIRGENSKLLTTASLEEMARRHPGMTAKIAIGQGHAPILHLGDIPAAIRRFLATI
ncbi:MULTISPECIES: alpha/beta hydrolase [unclassified Rhizobium]|uniref:alpha/beta fold hydrolase n=1 Tax=unclassified Rhizobium TaxID=2613769 RepID=UPI000CDF4700|nr:MULTISPECIES: alpha/beta hydrolase [Rhizobium]AVA20900.1 alpha/beta hydrolase family protein [Rhizobium sp. NXC24]MDK4739043.1 alpha/beta hydrolase [Rhizobium sp. CNPSo 3464]UWU22105.1 alpha/beta hydrolase [Rhizobium tropici]